MYLSVGFDNVYYKNVDHVQQNSSNKNHVSSRRRYITRPLIILSSWNPPKPDILYTALGILPIYRTLLLETDQSEKYNMKQPLHFNLATSHAPSIAPEILPGHNHS